MAIVSLVTGVLSFMCLFFTGIPAIILGVLSLKKINKSGGQLAGTALAIVGIVAGSIGTIFSTAVMAGIAAPAVIAQKEKADNAHLVSQLKQVHIEITSYEIQTGNLPSVRDVSKKLGELKIPGLYQNGAWRYFPQASMSTQGDPILISPESPRHEMIVLTTDGVIHTNVTLPDLRDLLEHATSHPVDIVVPHANR